MGVDGPRTENKIYISETMATGYGKSTSCAKMKMFD